jgi:hypothetical protein
VILGAAVQKGSTPEEASSLLFLLDNLMVDTGILNNVAELFSGGANGGALLINTGKGLLNALFGDRANLLVEALSSIGGLEFSSASKLLAPGVHLVLGFLKRFIGEKGLGAGSLASLLGSQGKYLEGRLDSCLLMALGFSSSNAVLSGLAKPAAARPATAFTSAPPPVKKASSRPWLLLGLAALGGLLLWQFLSQPTAPPKAVARMSAPMKAVVAECGFPAKIYFDVDEAVISPEGKQVIKEVAACIKAKDLKVELAGYTDKTGSRARNLELARERAQAVHDALISAGLEEELVILKAPLFHEISGTTSTGSDGEARRVEINTSINVK